MAQQEESYGTGFGGKSGIELPLCVKGGKWESRSFPHYPQALGEGSTNHRQ